MAKKGCTADVPFLIFASVDERSQPIVKKTESWFSGKKHKRWGFYRNAWIGEHKEGVAGIIVCRPDDIGKDLLLTALDRGAHYLRLRWLAQ